MAHGQAYEPVERVRGMLDHLPEAAEHQEEIVRTLAALFDRSGFRPVQAPIIEFAELFLRKSGADVASKMYAFTDHGGRRVCLRPEVTAPVARLYASHAHQFTLPARLWYSGPAFRYEKPQRGRYRQFTQIGVELLGARAGMADAELIALACAGLDQLGIGDYRVVLGHLGVVLSMLSSLHLGTRMQAAVLQSLEGLKKSPASAASTRQWLAELLGLEGADSSPDVPAPDEDVRALLASMDRGVAKKLIHSLLGTMKAELGGGREPDEIVERLLDRLVRTGDAERLERALQLVGEVAAVAGPREQAVPATERLLRQYGVPLHALDEFREVCSAIEAFGVDWSRVTVDLSLGRGLQYYTGPVFEIYRTAHDSESQLCGGGRYDGLVRELGGKEDVPALGFSFGLERLALARPWPDASAQPRALVVPLDDTARAAAVGVAEQLRDGGIRAELDVRSRGRRLALDYAGRAGCAVTILVDGSAVVDGTVQLRWMRSGVEQAVPRDRLLELVTTAVPDVPTGVVTA